MNTGTMQRTEGFIYLALFALTIPLANWMIGNVGTVCFPDGPCVIPVWPGITAPSGVLAVGFALVLRDLVQRRLGAKWALGAIVVGAALSGFVAAPALVVASVVAFLFAESADLAVFTPLQKRGLITAVVASSFVGLVVDSVLFLWLAFGSLDFLTGQVMGKVWAVVVSIPVIWLIRRWDMQRGLTAA